MEFDTTNHFALGDVKFFVYHRHTEGGGHGADHKGGYDRANHEPGNCKQPALDGAGHSVSVSVVAMRKAQVMGFLWNDSFATHVYTKPGGQILSPIYEIWYMYFAMYPDSNLT